MWLALLTPFSTCPDEVTLESTNEDGRPRCGESQFQQASSPAALTECVADMKPSKESANVDGANSQPAIDTRPPLSWLSDVENRDATEQRSPPGDEENRDAKQSRSMLGNVENKDATEQRTSPGDENRDKASGARAVSRSGSIGKSHAAQSAERSQRSGKVLIVRRKTSTELAAAGRPSDDTQTRDDCSADSADDTNTAESDEASASRAEQIDIAAKMSQGLQCFSQTGDIKYLLALFRSFIGKPNAAGDKYVQ